MCSALPQEAIVIFLQTSEHPKLISLIPLVLSRASQLQTEQRAGIMFACLVFGGLHWSNAIKMLQAVSDSAREETIELFRVFAQRTHGREIATWLSENWKYVQPV